MKKLIVPNKYNNKKLDSFIFNEFPNLSYNLFYKTLRKKDLRINDVRVNEDKIVHEFDTITIFIVDELLYKNYDIKTIFEDENILVVNKPAELEVVTDEPTADSLTKILNKKYTYISPCHRIDRNTTGLVLFAKNPEALEILVSKFKNKEIKKNYRCTVIGTLNKKEALLKAYLFKDNKKSIVYISDTSKKGYMEILTKYKVLSEDKASNTSVLDVELITGRTHQIRAHLAHIGHPILGDGKYGVNEINKKFKCKYQMLENYKMKFDFTTDSGALEYLNKKEIILK